MTDNSDQEPIKVFVSYSKRDSDLLGGLVPDWIPQIQEFVRTAVSRRVDFYYFENPTRSRKSDWRELIKELIANADLFVPFITQNYLVKGFELDIDPEDAEVSAIELELTAAQERRAINKEFVFPVVIRSEPPTGVQCDEARKWLLSLDHSPQTPLNLRRYYAPGSPPPLHSDITNDIIAWVETIIEKRGDIEVVATRDVPRTTRSDSGQKDGSSNHLAQALQSVYGDIKLSLPDPLPQPISNCKWPINAESIEDKTAALCELAVLLDEGANDEVLQAWIDTYLKL